MPCPRASKPTQSTPPFVRKLTWPHNWHEPDVRFSGDSQAIVVAWHEEDDPETLTLGKGRFAAWDRATGQRRFDPVTSHAEVQRWTYPRRIPVDLGGAPVVLKLTPWAVAAMAG